MIFYFNPWVTSLSKRHWYEVSDSRHTICGMVIVESNYAQYLPPIEQEDCEECATLKANYGINKYREERDNLCDQA